YVSLTETELLVFTIPDVYTKFSSDTTGGTSSNPDITLSNDFSHFIFFLSKSTAKNTEGVVPPTYKIPSLIFGEDILITLFKLRDQLSSPVFGFIPYKLLSPVVI